MYIASRLQLNIFDNRTYDNISFYCYSIVWGGIYAIAD